MKVDELKEVEVAVEMMVVEELEVLEVEETMEEVVLVVEAGKEEVLGIVTVSC